MSEKVSKQDFLQRVFGSGKELTPQEAIQQLRGINEKLLKKLGFIETKVESELTIVKKNGTRNKQVALQSLKRKKQYEKQLQQIDGALTTIEFLQESLENVTTNIEVRKTLGSAAKALNKALNNIDLDEVHDEVMEHHGLVEEIDRDIDEDDLQDELEYLMREEVIVERAKVDPIADDLPSIPSTEPPASEKDTMRPTSFR